MSDSENKLWAPWRIEYVLREKQDECIFCTKSSPEVNDRNDLVLCRGAHSFVLMNLYPYNNGHLMISPYMHVAAPGEIDDATHLEMVHFMQQWIAVLRHSMDPEGFNTGANLGKVAGAGVEDHYHIHIVPRWVGDTNFMPVTGHTKVLVEALEETWDRLTATYEKIYGSRDKTR